MSVTHSTLREQLVQAAHLLFQSGVMSHSGHGNMSARLPQAEHMLLTSTGLITHLTHEQLAITTFDGDVVEGTLDPTTREIIAMHAGVYRARADVHQNRRRMPLASATGRNVAFLVWGRGRSGWDTPFLDLPCYQIDREHNRLIVAGNAVILPDG